MTQLNSFAALFARVLTVEAFLFIGLMMALAYWQRRRLAAVLKTTVHRALWESLSFSVILAFSVRFWEYNGTSTVFWLFDTYWWQTAFLPSPNWILNFALYVPLAVLFVLSQKTWWKVSVGLVGLTFVIETLQTITGWGVGDPADFVSNVAGSLFGVGVGMFLLKRKALRT